MKFALVSGEKTEAKPGLRGTCSHCQGDTIAHCGTEKIWHWKHKRKSSCDPWWENETEWHREWKNLFRVEWQEVNHTDPTTGEKHIADIKTDKEFVLEFQHSAIKSEEIRSREVFYKNMVWVVDGTRLTRDFPRFHKGFSYLRSLTETVFVSAFPEECFPESWVKSSVPVYFDFQGLFPVNRADILRANLWCLFPGRVDRDAGIERVSRERFIKESLNSYNLLGVQEILSAITKERAIASQRVYLPAPYAQYTRRRGRL